ncbi:MAG TPA: hypothetical protein VN764_13485, partial [Polyangiaceae bacterium]|nr:hypothetical protein [Polyangiaceae bacterium]
MVDAAIPLPGNIPAVLEVRRRLYEELAELYKGTSWPLSPESGADEFLLIDATDTICNFPAETWE